MECDPTNFKYPVYLLRKTLSSLGSNSFDPNGWYMIAWSNMVKEDRFDSKLNMVLEELHQHDPCWDAVHVAFFLPAAKFNPVPIDEHDGYDVLKHVALPISAGYAPGFLVHGTRGAKRILDVLDCAGPEADWDFIIQEFYLKLRTYISRIPLFSFAMDASAYVEVDIAVFHGCLKAMPLGGLKARAPQAAELKKLQKPQMSEVNAAQHMSSQKVPPATSGPAQQLQAKGGRAHLDFMARRPQAVRLLEVDAEQVDSSQSRTGRIVERKELIAGGLVGRRPLAGREVEDIRDDYTCAAVACPPKHYAASNKLLERRPLAAGLRDEFAVTPFRNAVARSPDGLASSKEVDDSMQVAHTPETWNTSAERMYHTVLQQALKAERAEIEAWKADKLSHAREIYEREADLARLEHDGVEDFEAEEQEAAEVLAQQAKQLQLRQGDGASTSSWSATFNMTKKGRLHQKLVRL